MRWRPASWPRAGRRCRRWRRRPGAAGCRSTRAASRRWARARPWGVDGTDAVDGARSGGGRGGGRWSGGVGRWTGATLGRWGGGGVEGEGVGAIRGRWGVGKAWTVGSRGGPFDMADLEFMAWEAREPVRAVQYVDLETGTAVGVVPDPSPGPGDVVVAVEACGLCGSDVHALQAGQPEAGAILGHEFSGRIVALGVGRDRVGRGAAGGGVADRVVREVPGVRARDSVPLPGGAEHRDQHPGRVRRVREGAGQAAGRAAARRCRSSSARTRSRCRSGARR